MRLQEEPKDCVFHFPWHFVTNVPGGHILPLYLKCLLSSLLAIKWVISNLNHSVVQVLKFLCTFVNIWRSLPLQGCFTETQRTRPPCAYLHVRDSEMRRRASERWGTRAPFLPGPWECHFFILCLIFSTKNRQMQVLSLNVYTELAKL